MSRIGDAVPAAGGRPVGLAPESWGPGGPADPVAERRGGPVGAALTRVDGVLKVTGSAPFAAEVALEGMVYAALAFSSVARGRITTLDTGDAEAADGVVLVMTHRNAPPMRPAPVFLTAPKGAAGDDLPVMQDDRIRWNGEPIALVLARTQEQAEHAASLVRAGYDVEPATTAYDRTTATLQDAEFAGESLTTEVGDAEAALAAAEHRVDLTYRTPRYNHNAIEPHAATLVWQGDELRVHDATQGVVHTAWSLAQVFGMDEDQVRVTSPFVGGGFGGKTLWQHQILAAAAAKLAGRAVRIALSREGVFRVVGGRAPTEQRVAIGARADGRFTALVHTGVSVKAPHNALPEPFVLPTQGLYAADAILLRVQVTDTDTLANTFMRAPGESVGTFALESAVDELADTLGIDPIELRIRNEPERDPTSGLEFSSRHLVEALRAGAARFGWDRRDPRPRSGREGEWLVGTGVAVATYPYQRMPGGAARLTLTRDGQVSAQIAAHEMGMGTATVHTQVLAERMGLPVEAVTVAYGDSALPGVVLAGGSQQTASVGASIIAAHRRLVARLLEAAGPGSPLHGLGAQDVGGVNGGLAGLDEPSRCETYGSLLDRAGLEELTVQAEAPAPQESSTWSMHSYGGMFAEVRVNEVTGELRVSRFLGSFDCGRILNARTAASQFRGGIIMGLGMALMEQTQVDERTGRIMNPSLAEYHVPVHADVPEIDVLWTDIPDPHTPMGAHGVGEIGITGVAAAVANAVHHATGRRVRELPITLDRLR